MDVSSRRLAPVQHRHLPARGLLSLFSLLRAFLLNAIKRNQASGKWEDFFALQSTGGVEWASFTRTSAVPKRTTCGGQDERIATDISTSAGFADHPRPYSPDGVGGSRFGGYRQPQGRDIGTSSELYKLSEVYRNFRNSIGTLSELHRRLSELCWRLSELLQTCIGTTSVGPV